MCLAWLICKYIYTEKLVEKTQGNTTHNVNSGKYYVSTANVQKKKSAVINKIWEEGGDRQLLRYINTRKTSH